MSTPTGPPGYDYSSLIIAVLAITVVILWIFGTAQLNAQP